MFGTSGFAEPFSNDIFTEMPEGGFLPAQSPSLSNAAIHGGRWATPPLELGPDDEEAAVEES